MPVEIEAKYSVKSHAAIVARLEELGAKRQRYENQTDVLYDTTDRRLRASDLLLRLRTSDEVTLTYKGELQPGSAVKAREEIEVAVADAERMKLILQRLGFEPSGGYNKRRETWLLEGVLVCLDSLEFGDFVEVEGPEAGVIKVSGLLGFDVADAVRASYGQLAEAWRRGR